VLNHLTWVDYVIAAVIGLSILIGLGRGLLKEAISLAAWIAAFFVAFLFAEEGAVFVNQYIEVPPVSVNLTVSQLVDYTGLGGTDRLLGAVFGLLRGGAVIATLVLLVGLTPLTGQSWWNDSLLLPYFQPLAEWLRSMLPLHLLESIKLPQGVPL
jgi:membrane protein required for colicin V production